MAFEKLPRFPKFGGISTALQVYIDCASNNDRHDDSSSEFSTLQSPQEDFEDAVSQYESECN